MSDFKDYTIEIRGAAHGYSTMHAKNSAFDEPLQKAFTDGVNSKIAAKIRKDEAVEFVDWYNENSWQEDFSAEATHTTEQLYELFLQYKSKLKAHE